jgi:hypothetical protein
MKKRLLQLLLALLGLSPARPLAGQEAPPPFSEEELFQALRQIMEEEHARWLARDLARDSALPLPDPRLPPPPSEGLAYTVEPTASLTEDTLILLSLLSESMAARVERYRSEHLGIDPGASQLRERWEERRRELLRLRESRSPVRPI